MRAFELYDAASVADAVNLLKQNSDRTVKVVGGGSDLIGGIMKDWVHGNGLKFPDVLVDLTTIKDLTTISAGGDGATVGAAVTLSDVIDHKDLQAKFPLLVAAAQSVASPLIRNFGTLGGNVNQRPRCWFFRGEDFNCYKKGGDFCYAVTGDNRYHAIIGGELCYIVHPSDTATALLALNASAKIAGPLPREGRRGCAQGQGHQGDHQAGGGADPHRGPPDEPERVQGRPGGRSHRADRPGCPRDQLVITGMRAGAAAERLPLSVYGSGCCFTYLIARSAHWCSDGLPA